MASAILRKLYFDARKANVGCIVGEHALSARRASIVLARWHALHECGAVGLVIRPDLDWQPGCDCGDPKCASNNPESEAFGVVGLYRTDFDNLDSDGCWDWSPCDVFDDRIDWEHGDSVWGCAGYRNAIDWKENPYILDIMEQTIAAFRDAWKDHVHHRCQACHGTGVVA